MTKEDVEFLIELQHELNTQDNDGQADPRFWGIIEEKDVPCYEGQGDKIHLFDDWESYSGDELVQYIIDYYYDDFDDDQKEEWDNVDKSDDYAIKEFLIDNDFFDYGDFYETEKKHILSEETGCFLTKRACQLHIDQNGYHYSKPHTYAMTAWRNPEFERLLHILKTTDFSKLIDKEE